MKDLVYKWNIVKYHYEAAYHVEFRRKLKREEIEDLYDKLVQLKWDEQHHFERRPALRLLIDNTCKPANTTVNAMHDG